MRIFPLLLMASGLAACSTAPPTMERSAMADARLQQGLAGLAVAGPATSCIPRYRADRMTVIDDNTLLFRDSPGRVWRNETQGGCRLLRSGYTLVLRQGGGGSQLCSGEIGQVVDLQSGASAGSCVLGDFIPYARS